MPITVLAAGRDLSVHSECADHQVMVAPVRLECDAPVGGDVGQRVGRRVAVAERLKGRHGKTLVGGEVGVQHVAPKHVGAAPPTIVV